MQDADQPARSCTSALLALLVCGLVLAGTVLFQARVAADYGIAMLGYRSAIRALFEPAERSFGAIPRDEGDSTVHRTRLFLQSQVVAWCAFLGAVGIVLRRCRRGHKGALALILSGAVVFRVILALSPPLLENSIHRYLWDGAVSAAGVNPFRYSPDEVAHGADEAQRQLYPDPQRRELLVLNVESRDSLRVSFHFKLITYPTLRTIYPPMAQLIFGTAALIEPGNQDVLKLVTSAIDLATLALVIILLVRLGRDPNWCVLYAWSPLVLKEFANSGHIDVAAGFFVMVGLLYLMGRRPALAGASFAAAALAKVYPLVLAVVFRRSLGRVGLVVMAGVGIIGLTPQLAETDFQNHGLVAYARHWESNSSLYGLVGAVLTATGVDEKPPTPGSTRAANSPLRKPITRVVVIGLLFLFLCWLSTFPQETPEDIATLGLWGVGAMLLFSPVVLPWYVAWIAPHLALLPSLAWGWWTLAVNLWYVKLVMDIHDPGTPIIHEVLRGIEYVPFFALLYRERRRRQHASATPPQPDMVCGQAPSEKRTGCRGATGPAGTQS